MSNMASYRKVPTVRRLVSSSVTSRDYDVILVTSQSSSSRRIRKLEPGSTIHVDPHTLSYNVVFKKSAHSARTVGEEVFGDCIPTKIRHFFTTSAIATPCLVFAVCSVKLSTA